MSLINTGGDIYVGVCDPGLSLFGLLVVEMRGEEDVLSVELRDF